MSRSTSRGALRFAGLAALAGVILASGLGLAVPDDRSPRIAGYALGGLPLAVGLGAFAGRLWGNASPDAGGGWRGAALALVTALVVAEVLALIRFRQAGATGLLAVSALWYTEEFLMLVPLLPAIGLLGAGAARRGAGRGLAGWWWPVSMAAIAAVLVGPALIVVSILGRSGLLSPPVVALLGLVLLWWVERRARR